MKLEGCIAQPVSQLCAHVPHGAARQRGSPSGWNALPGAVVDSHVIESTERSAQRQARCAITEPTISSSAARKKRRGRGLLESLLERAGRMKPNRRTKIARS